MSGKRALGDVVDPADGGAGPSYSSKRQKPWSYDGAGEISDPINAPFVLEHESYTIAWICALHIEMAAARAMLDQVHQPVQTHHNDSNTYVLGNIGPHNIVMACLPNDQYGTNNAATVLMNLTRTFPSIRLGLMVGVGGGAPTMADLRLGDVVVGTRVMQYDLGKIVEDGEIKRTAIPRIPDALACTAVSALRSQHELKASSISSILRERLGGYPQFGHPKLPDRLFSAAYQHDVASNVSCDKCQSSEQVLRGERSSSDPAIHYGVIASGNQVMRSGSTRDNIARQLQAVCFEMEAAGLMNILPCLPIRGICDYSDSHKNKEWQRYSAATAAAYARELIGVLPATGASTGMRLTVRTDQPSSSGTDRRKKMLASLRYEQIDSRKLSIKFAHAKTCRWFLEHPDYQAWLDSERLSEHHGFLWIRGKPGAGKSTMMKFIYTETKKNQRGRVVASFFFHARGESLQKSVLGMYRSLLLQLLEGYPNLQTVLDDEELTPQGEIELSSLNILKELFCNAVALLDQRPLTLFIDALDESDEQQVRDMVQYFEELAENSNSMGISLRICFSSRHYPYLDTRRGLKLTLENQPGHTEDLTNYVESRLRIEDAELLEELKAQVLEKSAGVFLWVVLVVDILNKENSRGRLALKKRLAGLPGGLGELFKDMLTRDRENMEELLLSVVWILYAKRPLEPREYYHGLWSGLSLKGLVDNEIPIGTASDFGDIVKNCITSSSKGLAEITKSKIPTVQFIHESVRDFLIKDGGLYELWPNLGFDIESPSHDILKQCCSNYLNNLSVRNYCKNVRAGAGAGANSKIVNQYPFLEYACHNVLFHADAAAKSIAQDTFLSTFLVPEWIGVSNIFEKAKVRQYQKSTSLLYLLAERNLANLIKINPNRLSYLRPEEERYGPPLFAALALGSYLAVQSFLEAHVEAQPDPHLQSLCRIYSEGDYRRVELGRTYEFAKSEEYLRPLLQSRDTALSEFLVHSIFDNRLQPNDNHDCSSSAASGIFRPSLEAEFIEEQTTRPGVFPEPEDKLVWMAAEFGNAAILRLLIDNGCNISLNNSDGTSLFSYAIRRRAYLNPKAAHEDSPLSHRIIQENERVVQLLIDNGADIESKDENGKTPLSHAVCSNNEAAVRLLLERGADPNSEDSNCVSPLSYAASDGSELSAKLLLDKGANFNSKDENYGRCPLSYAAGRGHTAIVQLLINRGAPVESIDNRGRSPLSHAVGVSEGSEATIQLLVGNGADVDLKDSWGRSPLSWAGSLSRMSEELLRLLIGKSVALDSKDRFSYTPLYYAVKSGNGTMVRLLLERNANIYAKCADGQPILFEAIRSNTKGAVGLLLDEDVDLDLKYDAGNTPLSLAASRGEAEVARWLLATGRVDPESRNEDGETPLCRAAGRGDPVIVRHLLAIEDLNPDCKDSAGNTPLLLASSGEHPDETPILHFPMGSLGFGLYNEVVWELLATRRVNVNTANQSGDTPLHKASRSGQHEIVQQLLATEGIDPNVRNNNGRTPLSEAVSNEPPYQQVVRKLLATTGTDVNSRDNDGNTPLFHAVDKETVQQLLATGQVDLNIKNNAGDTALHRFISCGNLNTAKELISAEEIDIDSKNGTGATPLLLAVKEGLEAIVQGLLKTGGVDIDSRDHEGETPLSLASRLAKREPRRKRILRILQAYSILVSGSD
ncbi:hypothetical protein TWF481_006262 [Arthrobotrys musiformis]|uniref:NACHT domain-containing protein n=1 Tax=Arthrobotrys musiformis TaxID=47236 RepID=A0AAV9WG46_9PEZI